MACGDRQTWVRYRFTRDEMRLHLHLRREPSFSLGYPKSSTIRGHQSMSMLNGSVVDFHKFLHPAFIAMANQCPDLTYIQLAGSENVDEQNVRSHGIKAYRNFHGRPNWPDMEAYQTFLLSRAPGFEMEWQEIAYQPLDLASSPKFKYVTRLGFHGFDFTDNLAWLWLFPNVEHIECYFCRILPLDQFDRAYQDPASREFVPFGPAVRELPKYSLPAHLDSLQPPPFHTLPMLAHLRELWWDDRTLTDLPPLVYHAPNLEVLTLEGTDLQRFPDISEVCPRLQEINLADSGLRRFPFAEGHPLRDKIQRFGSKKIATYSHCPPKFIHYQPTYNKSEFRTGRPGPYSLHLSPLVVEHVHRLIPVEHREGPIRFIGDLHEKYAGRKIYDIGPSGRYSLKELLSLLKDEYIRIYQTTPGDLLKKYILGPATLSEIEYDRLLWELEPPEVDFLADHTKADDPLLRWYRQNFLAVFETERTPRSSQLRFLR